jgi:alkanesulfonate monooxygenase SsuD/methylene tetrahydromethanopterin reductase-like flavin-dependent oxidoreductase (luciferase family)
MQMVGLFGLANSHLLWTREAFPTRAYQSLANLAPTSSGGGNPADPYGIPEGICVGDPERIGEAIRRWESIGVDGINFIVNAMEVITQPAVLASLRLFAREVLPQFQAKPQLERLDAPARAGARS